MSFRIVKHQIMYAHLLRFQSKPRKAGQNTSMRSALLAESVRDLLCLCQSLRHQTCRLTQNLQLRSFPCLASSEAVRLSPSRRIWHLLLAVKVAGSLPPRANSFLDAIAWQVELLSSLIHLNRQDMVQRQSQELQ